MADYAFGSTLPTGYPRGELATPRGELGMPGARPARSAPMSAVALGALVRITFACLPSSKTTYASTNVTACRLQFQDSTMKTVLFGLFAAIIFCTTAVASEPGTPTAT